jgi:polyhydroxyalkanoate synthesis regulator phasin
VLVLLASFTLLASAADTSTAKAIRGFFGFDTSKLTDTQKNDLMDSYKKMAEVQKEAVNKMVANGAMTKEQGDAAIKSIDESFKNIEENGFTKGFGMGKGGFRFFGIGKSAPQLTDQQKADLKEFQNKMAELQKKAVSSMVSNGALTKEQGDTAIKNIEDTNQKYENTGNTKGFDMMKGYFGIFGIKGLDTSKLSDSQKTDLKAAYSNMADLQKEYINKMAANGLMTKEQAESAINRVDEMLKNAGENGLVKGSGMNKGSFSGHGKRGGNQNLSKTSLQ